MSLIKCKKCSREYSVIKDNCPYCGQSQKEPPDSTAQHIPAKKKKELYILPPEERKSPILAAIFSFLFWWIALDTFYLKGLFKGFFKLAIMYIIFPILWFIALNSFFLFVWQVYEELNAPELITLPFLESSRFLAILFAYFLLLGILGTLSGIITAIYYVALPVGQFNRQYNSYIVKE